jgi:predicted nucleic acid-binding protein
LNVVLDTSAVSALMHRDPEALSRLRAYRPDEVYLSSPVAAEIGFGLSRLTEGSRRQAKLRGEYRRLREVLEWVDWTERAAALFGVHKAALERSGQLIDDMDVTIASVAMSIDARVATFNARHFNRVEGLDVDDWGQRST